MRHDANLYRSNLTLVKMMTIIIILLFISAICGVCAKKNGNGDDYDNDDYLLMKQIFMTITYTWFSTFFRFLIQTWKIPLSCGAATLTFTTLCSLILHYLKRDDYSPLRVPEADFFNVFLPLVVFKISFGVDMHAFYKSLPQILIMCFPAAILSVAFCTYVVTKIIGYFWDFSSSVILGVLFTASYPIEIVDHLANLGEHTRHKRVLLEGDFLIATTVCYFVIKLATSSSYNWKTLSYITLKFFGPSILSGLILAILGKFMLRYISNKISIALATLSLPYITTFIVDYFMKSSSFMAILIIGLVMSSSRLSLLKDIDQTLVNFWTLVSHLINSFAYVIIAHQILYKVVIFKIRPHDLALVLVTYMIGMVGRFLSFFIFFPLISRTGYEYSFKSMLVCVWGGLGSPIIYSHNKSDAFLIHLIAFFYLTHLINSSLSYYVFKFMGIAKISIARQANMNACLRYIQDRRDDTIAILKKDRFLADSNWLVVNKTTTLSHPYNLQMDYVVEKEHFFVKGYRAAFCNDCKKNVYGDPTPREFKEMAWEAKTRVLKAMKISYSKQYENGMMSATTIRNLLQVVEKAMDSEKAIIELEDLLKDYHKKGFFSRSAVRQYLDKSFKMTSEELKPPRRPRRRCIYYIVRNKFFEASIYMIVGVNLAMNSCKIALKHDFHIKPQLYYAYIFVNITCIAIYCAEFIMKILAYSFIYLYKDGIKTYYRSKWNILEFILLCIAIPDWIFLFVKLLMSWHEFSRIITDIFNYLSFLRALRFLKLLLLFRNCYAKLMKFYDAKTDTRIAYYYELGKSYVTAVDEVLEKLPYMVDHIEIRSAIREQLHDHRLIVLKHLGIIQYEKPTIAMTVKTVQAIRTILNGMRDTLEELKVTGWVESREYKKLNEILEERYTYVAYNIKTVNPNTPDTIFRETIFLVNEDETVINYIFRSLTKKPFKAGDILLNEGDTVEGIHILVRGLFSFTYNPRATVLEKLQDYGLLPTVDNLPTGKFNENYVDFMVPGNCCGRLAVLTQRPFNGILKAETDGEVYLIKSAVLQKAMRMSSDPVKGLECKLWYSIAIHIAIPLLVNVSYYQTDTQDKIKYVLERGFSPKLADYKQFEVNEFVEDIVLIEGLAIDFATKNIYTAPRYIPRTVKKLLLPKSSYLNLPINIQTRFLIVPARNANEYDIMFQNYSDSDGRLLKSPSFEAGYYNTRPSLDYSTRSQMSVNIFRSFHRLSNRVTPITSQTVTNTTSKPQRPGHPSDENMIVMFGDQSALSFLMNI